MVWSRDVENGAEGFHPVVTTFVHENFALLEVNLIDGDRAESIVTTAEHPWFVEGQGFLRTDELQAGDTIAAAQGASLSLESVDVLTNRATVYNFEVDATHTYFVGTSSALVHNLKQDIAIPFE